MTRRIIGLLLFLFAATMAHAHKPSDSYLSLQLDAARAVGQWDIALRDLDFAIGLDSDSNGDITWGEVTAKHSDIVAYAMARLDFYGDGKPCPVKVTDHLIDNHTDGSYAVMRFVMECPDRPNELEVKYRLFFDLDPQHKGLLRLQRGEETRAAIFSPETAEQKFTLEGGGGWKQFRDYLMHGMEHIWLGYDHILFLISLLLPAVVFRTKGAWRPVGRFHEAFIDVVKVVTSFTIAHSITLTMAALGIASVPSRITESVIAISIVVAALNNVFPVIEGRRWAVAFGFGLLHGFGFASVLQDLGLPRDALVAALIGFNAGVEAGQLVIVAIFLPVAFWLRATSFYRKAVLAGGSTAIVFLAALWFTERVFDVKFMPF
ncbi:MAG TPA: HupE/UreJ family protein [Burkholderiales bacterium]|nr:HupE/UreJ family protein [Burkholderiales bacterium]